MGQIDRSEWNQANHKKARGVPVGVMLFFHNLLATILTYGKICLNLIWQLDRELQEHILTQNAKLTKSQAKKKSIGWDTDINLLSLPTSKLQNKFDDILTN